MKQLLKSVENLSEVWFVGSHTPGQPPQFRILEPGLSLDGALIFKELRSIYAVLRMHRLPVTDMVWDLEKGSVMATKRDDLICCLVTSRNSTELAHLWPLLKDES